MLGLLCVGLLLCLRVWVACCLVCDSFVVCIFYLFSVLCCALWVAEFHYFVVLFVLVC